jgi:hypothetical protein
VSLKDFLTALTVRRRACPEGHEPVSPADLPGRSEEAVQVKYLGQRQAEIKAQAELVATVLSAITKQRNAIVRMGPVVVVKTQGDLAVWTNREIEAAQLEKNSDLLGDPAAALTFLRDSTQAPKGTGFDPHLDKDALTD